MAKSKFVQWVEHNIVDITAEDVGDITSIGSHAFVNCRSLTSVTIPDSVTLIGEDAFYGCSSLTSVTIGSGVTSIGGRAFSDCRNLTSVTIGDSVTSIGNSAFSRCKSLTSITIPDSVTLIGVHAFSECTSLTSVTIPDSVIEIGNYAFSDCRNLTSVTIGDSVTSIGNSAFTECTSLAGVYITDIAKWCAINFSGSGSNPLHYARNLYLNDELVTDLVIPNSVTSIGKSAFYGCSSLNSVTIPNSVTEISEYTFRSCSGLTSVTIPNTVTSIGNSAFDSCSGLTSVTIPNSVTSIGNSAFSFCYGLADITSLNPTPPTIKSNTFQNVPAACKINVPYQSVSTYKSAQYWSNRANYIEPDNWQAYYYSIMNNLADTINTKAGTENVKTIEEMTAIVESDLVNTSSGDATAADIKSGKIAWVDGQEIVGTASGNDINNLVGYSTVYLDTYLNIWKTLATNTTPHIVRLACNCGPNPGDPEQHDYLYTDDLSWSYYVGTSSPVNVNGFTVNPTKVLYYNWTHWDGSNWTWVQEDTPVAYYDGSKIYWVTSTISTSGSVVSVLYANANYKSLFANASVSYGTFVYKDNNLIPESIQENTIVGDLQDNAGIKGSLRALNDLVGHSNVYIDSYASYWSDNQPNTEGTLLTLTLTDNSTVSLEWVSYNNRIDVNGYVVDSQYVLVARSGADQTYLCYYGWLNHGSLEYSWITKQFNTHISIRSVSYADSSLQEVFANSNVSYGMYLYGTISSSALTEGPFFNYNLNGGVYGSLLSMVPWLPSVPTNDNKWSDIYFNTAADWDALFNELDSQLDPSTDGFGVLFLGDLDEIYPSTYEFVVASINTGGSFTHVLEVLPSGSTNLIPVYASDNIDVTVPFGEDPIRVVATQGWNTTHINYFDAFGIVNGYSPYISSSPFGIKYDMKGSESGVLYIANLLTTLNIADVQHICAGVPIAYGDYIDLNNLPHRTLTITSNGEYNVKDLLQYDKVVFANVGSVLTPTVSSTHGLTDNQLNFNDDFTYSVNNDLKLGVDATVSGDDLTFTE